MACDLLVISKDAIESRRMEMDRELPYTIVRKRKIKRLVSVLVVLLLLAISYYSLRALITRTIDCSKIETAVAEIGPIEATVSASGVVIPQFEQIITAPVNSTIEAVFLRSGDSVKAGQSILQLDKEQLQLSYEKLTDELGVHKNRKQQLSLDSEKKLIDLQASYEIKELETRFIQSQHDRMKKLHEIGGAAEEDVERAALDVDIARRELSRLGQEIENQRASVRVALEGLDLQIRIQENKINEVRRQLELAEARSGRDGVITFVNENIGSPANAGDIVARVADLSSYKIEASISDIHAGTLKPGGAVRVRIGERILSGWIGNVRPTVQNGIVTFIVELEHESDPSLRPNLRADVFVVTDIKDSILRVKNGPFYTGLVDQKIFVIDEDRAIGRTVDIGVANFDYVEIRGDISPGDEVIISDTKRYRHMDEIALEGRRFEKQKKP